MLLNVLELINLRNLNLLRNEITLNQILKNDLALLALRTTLAQMTQISMQTRINQVINNKNLLFKSFLTQFR